MNGLREYGSQNSGQSSGANPSNSDEKQKVASIVGILGHLGQQHSNDIRKALISLFKVGYC